MPPGPGMFAFSLESCLARGSSRPACEKATCPALEMAEENCLPMVDGSAIVAGPGEPWP